MTDFVKLTRRVAILCACAAALASAPADAAPRFGIAEDATKYAEDGGAAFYARMKSLKMTENRIAVRWNPVEPTEILEKKFLDRAVPVAEGSGIRLVFDVFAIDPLAFGLNTEARATLFGAYLQKLARTYPEVTDFIVANEPNEAFFWRPQFGPGGEQASAADFLRVLTHSYDALKAVEPGHPGDRGRSLRGGERPHVDVAGPLPRRSRRRVPPERPTRPAHGRARLPRLSAAKRPSAVAALRLAERRRRRFGPDQAGRVGRLQRHRAADVPRRSRQAQRGRSRARDRRVRLASGHRRRAWRRATTARRTCPRSRRPSRPSTTRS